MRLHRGGRWRAWLGARLGGDEELGDRAWRRMLHGAGALVVLYYAIPPGLLWIPTIDALLLALLVVLALEAARWGMGLDLPTIRPHERGRPASFAYFAVALVLAVTVFPEPIAVAVILGAALVDPLIGELRLRAGGMRWYPWLPIALYAILAGVSFRVVGGWTVAGAATAAILAGALGVRSEALRVPWLDDDFLMVVVPGALLSVLLLVLPGLASLGG